MAAAGLIDLCSSSDHELDLHQLNKASLDVGQPTRRLIDLPLLDSSPREIRYRARKRRKLTPSSDIDHGDILHNPSTSPTRRFQPSDPIVFTSSPQPRFSPPGHTTVAAANVSMSDLSDGNFPALKPGLSGLLSSKTNALLAPCSGNQMKKKEGRKVTKIAVEDDDADHGLAAQNVSKRKVVVAKVSKTTDASSKAEDRERKRLLKEQEQERKKLEKEQRAAKKQLAADLAEANKSKINKKLSTPEMMVDLPTSIAGLSADTQVRLMLKELGVEVTSNSSEIDDLVMWKRKVTCTFNEEAGHWEPTPLSIQDEKHIMCVLKAKQFVSMVAHDDAAVESLQEHVARLKQAFPGSRIIYLIEGLDAYMNKSKNARNREYQAAVIEATGLETAVPARRRKEPDPVVNEEVMEDALLELQVKHKCFLQFSTSPNDTAAWITTFTQQISTIPYKAQAIIDDVSFCMDTGQVRTGDSKDDTYVRMLQEVVRITAPIAYGIARAYPTVADLVEGFKRHGPLALEDIKKSANKNGALSDRRIGPAISKRLYRVFSERDPTVMDI